MIVFENVTKKYGQRKVLDDLSFKIDGGEMVAVAGPSGAGKSTLISALIGAAKVDNGKIMVDDFNVARMNLNGIQSYRRMIGIVFQDYKLLPKKTVFENVAFALEVCNYPKNVVNERTAAVLKLTGLSELRNHFPRELSGGESQRTAIARALVHDPDLLIADEPTGNLDNENAEAILELLRRINKNGATVIIATHNQDIIHNLCKRVIYLENGKLISDKKNAKN